MAQTDYGPREISLFGYNYGSAAPALEPEFEPVPPEKKKSAAKPAPKKKKEKRERAEISDEGDFRASLHSFFRSAKIFLVVASVFAVVSTVIYLNVTLDETAETIAAVQDEIDIAVSENTRLQSALEGMVSINKVEDYAENVLGMVKLEDYKITYFNEDVGNQVVVSGGKSYDDDSNTIAAKIKSLFE
ncbi:MAG: hypothetical protein LUG85_01485 [Clostridiales bacterium]|nr:hypothetical protein [Clostridiales bacterium]MCD7827198.1 hypothetical protein [Clostridiales bacterium]